MKGKEESEKAVLKFNIQKTKIMASCPMPSWQIDGDATETVTDFIFLSSKIISDGHCSHKIKRCFLLRRKAMINLDSILKSRDITLLTNVHVVKDFFFSSHVWIWELYHKEGWASKNLCFELWFGGRLLRVLWNANSALKIKPFNPKGNQSWIFIGKTDAEAETPVLRPPDVKKWLISKDPDAGKDWRQEEKGMTEDEMVRCHHWLNRYEFG